MRFIRELRKSASRLKKRIVLPEVQDERVLKAAKFIKRKGIAEVILLEKDKISFENKKRYAEVFFQMRKDKGLTIEEAEKIMEDPLYYAGMMTRLLDADGFVAGATYKTAEVIRAAIHCLGVDKEIGFAFGCFIVVLKDKNFGQEGVFLFADCGVIPQPTEEQLARIAIKSADFTKDILGFLPRVALLSFSTKGSSKVASVEKVKKAVELAKNMRADLLIDGELQLDSAIVPEVAKIKCPDSPLEGRANILIFPNLEAGNIGYKLVQRLAKARAIGPILLGLNKAISDLSRGCFVEDIIDAVAITSILNAK
ncbi:MAG: phosphate acetyltransferase [Candidatus Omnitrophica bacterium]|nr:phosphate acetyltransferase [Candidatus Omnitrophota bacterium]